MTRWHRASPRRSCSLVGGNAAQKYANPFLPPNRITSTPTPTLKITLGIFTEGDFAAWQTCALPFKVRAKVTTNAVWSYYVWRVLTHLKLFFLQYTVACWLTSSPTYELFQIRANTSDFFLSWVAIDFKGASYAISFQSSPFLAKRWASTHSRQQSTTRRLRAVASCLPRRTRDRPASRLFLSSLLTGRKKKKQSHLLLQLRRF